jgi:ABC-type Mn2+/Zn2+ transport system ATPase subunit
MIDVKELCFSRGKNQIFANFMIQLHPAELVLLTGANGAGKSTLIQLIGGILKPDSGRIEIDNQDIAKLSAKQQSLLRSVAPQRRSFSLAFTVKDVINLVPKGQRVDYLDFIVHTLDLNGLLTKKITELSIGQQERVSLALALHQQAPYYLLDEPFSAQDSHATTNILSVFEFLKVNKKGVLVISHNQDALVKNCDRQITLA